jgi:glycosyltransferase involved in cell wall biosynthesis
LLTDGGDGFVIDSPWDLDAMSERLGRLIDDRALREAMSVRARAAARSLTMEASRRRLLDALLRAAADPAASPRSRRAA